MGFLLSGAVRLINAQSREKHGDTAVLFSAVSVDQAHHAGKEKL